MKIACSSIARTWCSSIMGTVLLLSSSYVNSEELSKVTKIARMIAFVPAPGKSAQNILNATPSSWRKTNIYGLGVTNDCEWGKVKVKKGHFVTIKLISKVPGFHPAVSIWQRGIEGDTAPLNYVNNITFKPNDDFSEFNAVEPATGKKIGNIYATIVDYGFDLDGVTTSLALHGFRDKTPGQLILTFQAPETAVYTFAVGGFSPDKSVDPYIKHPIYTFVSVR